MTDTSTRTRSEAEYTLHWPAMGIECGEYTGSGSNTDVPPRVLVSAGIVSYVLRVGLMAVPSVVLTVFVVNTLGLELTPAIVVSPAAVVTVDAALNRWGRSPIRAVAGFVAATLVVVAVVSYARLSRDDPRGEFDNSETFVGLAGVDGRGVLLSLLDRSGALLSLLDSEPRSR